MILVKVAYDRQSQQFRLLDPDLMHMFDDGETYLVAVDIFPSDSTDWLDDATVDVLPAGIGHA
jgi:hypothetical protein